MKNCERRWFSPLLLSILWVGVLHAQPVSVDEAGTVARNWVALILQHEGAWGGHPSASVESIGPFQQNDQQLGYYCRVAPTGYVLVSLRKELAPVKATSEIGGLEVTSEDGLVGFLKRDMQRGLNTIRGLQLADATLSDSDPTHQNCWEELTEQDAGEQDRSGLSKLSYTDSEILLTTDWHQAWPYNNYCPQLNCTEPRLNGRAWVGCTATAAAQIMRYWSWPPSYDWLNMPDSIDAESPPAEIYAVALLSGHAGAAASMLYTCDWSFLLPEMMSAALGNSFRYNAAHELGFPHSQSGWHEMLKDQIDQRRPVLYGNTGEGHSVVVDGYRQLGSAIQWHLNYGWEGTADDTFYARDYAPVTDAIVMNITPSPSLGPLVFEDYATVPGGYHYFDQDCSGLAARFLPGQNLQFLPGVRVQCIDPAEGYISFLSGLVGSTKLLSIKGTRAAHITLENSDIEGAEVRLYREGAIRFF